MTDAEKTAERPYRSPRQITQDIIRTANSGSSSDEPMDAFWRTVKATEKALTEHANRALERAETKCREAMLERAHILKVGGRGLETWSDDDERIHYQRYLEAMWCHSEVDKIFRALKETE